MDRASIGFLLLGLSAVLWIIAALGTGDGLSFAALSLMAAGGVLAGATLSRNSVASAAGLVVMAVGVVVFYRGALFGGLAPVAGALFALASLGAAFAVARDQAMVRRAAAGLGAFAAALWVYADGMEGIGWQPGNVLAVLAWLLVATKA